MPPPEEEDGGYVEFTSFKYACFMNRVHPDRGAISHEPLHVYRGEARALAAALGRLARGLEFRRVPGDGDDPAACVGGMVPLARDQLAQALACIETYEDAKLFFQKYCCYARHLLDALGFLRRLMAHVLVCVNSSYYVYTTRELQKSGQRHFIATVLDKIADTVPPFAWRVVCAKRTYGVQFNDKVARDPAFGYETIIASIENPVARGHRPPQTPPGTLNIAGKMIHAEAWRGLGQAALDAQYEEAYADKDARAVFMHPVHLMAAADSQPADVREMHRRAGIHLLYTLAWCIQNPGMRSTLILAVFSMIQQCGKSTILALLRALLGARLVVSLPANQLKDRFLAFLRGALFLFLDEGAGAITDMIDFLKMLVGLDTFTSQSKGKDMISVDNVITILVTANEWYMPMQPDDRHLRLYYPPGVLQDNRAYFDHLRACFANVETMRRAFLLFSRVPLHVNVHEEFRVTSLCELACRAAENMSNQRMILVYRRMDDLIDRCKFAPMPSAAFLAQMTAVIACIFPPSEVDAIMYRILADLKLRGMISEDPRTKNVTSNIKRAVSVVANDVPATLAGQKRPREEE